MTAMVEKHVFVGVERFGRFSHNGQAIVTRAQIAKASTRFNNMRELFMCPTRLHRNHLGLFHHRMALECMAPGYSLCSRSFFGMQHTRYTARTSLSDSRASLIFAASSSLRNGLFKKCIPSRLLASSATDPAVYPDMKTILVPGYSLSI
jgi:hypothetical protein